MKCGPCDLIAARRYYAGRQLDAHGSPARSKLRLPSPPLVSMPVSREPLTGLMPGAWGRRRDLRLVDAL